VGWGDWAEGKGGEEGLAGARGGVGPGPALGSRRGGRPQPPRVMARACRRAVSPRAEGPSAAETPAPEAPAPPGALHLLNVSERTAASLSLKVLALAALVALVSLPAGAPHSSTLPQAPPGGETRALLLSSHGRALWWDAAAGAELAELHSGRGVYYGALPGGPLPADDSAAPGGATAWVVSRAHNWEGTEGSGRERLLRLAGGEAGEAGEAGGRVAGEAPFSATFSHDAVLAAAEGGAPARVLVADTGGGAIVELDPETMVETRRHEVFKRRDHVNTLAPSLERPGHVWAVLHGKGSGARLALVDLASGRVVHETRRFGADCHGLVMLREKRERPPNGEWPSGNSGGARLEDRWLTLNSGEGQLMVLEGLEAEASGGEPMRTHVLWADANRTFMKGLAVVDGVAYFGISEWGSRDERASPEKRAELAAFDLNAGYMLWRRWVDTRGLLNTVSAPQLGAASTYRESVNWEPTSPGDWAHLLVPPQCTGGFGTAGEAGGGASMAVAAGVPWPGVGSSELRAGAAPVSVSVDPSRPPVVSRLDHWLGLECKGQKLTKTCDPVSERRMQFPYGVVDVAPLQRHLRAHPEMWEAQIQAQSNVVIEGRSRNLQTFKGGTKGVWLIFSSSDARVAFTFPWWEELRPLLEPLLAPLLEPRLGSDWSTHLLRAQFALMPAGSEIKAHVDSGRWTKVAHRLHIPVMVPEGTVFRVRSPVTGDFEALELREGHAFELDNRLQHNVQNRNPRGESRVHFIVDFTEAPAPERPLAHAGSTCQWIQGRLTCHRATVNAAAGL